MKIQDTKLYKALIEEFYPQRVRECFFGNVDTIYAEYHIDYEFYEIEKTNERFKEFTKAQLVTSLVDKLLKSGAIQIEEHPDVMRSQVRWRVRLNILT